jgi:N-methylhydantoinase A
MDVLGIPRVLVPPDPGNVSAFGLLTVDVKNDYVRTHVTLDPQPAGVQAVLDALTADAHGALAKEGFPEDQRQFARTADLRYFGQAFEVRVPVPEGDVDAGTLATVAELFHAEHRALYGYDFAGDPTQQVEWVNLRVSGIGPITRPEIRRVDGGFETGARAPSSTTIRKVCFDAEDGYVGTPVLWRADLAPGTVVEGPAILEEFGSTVPLHPGFTARIDDYRNVIVERSAR